MIAEPRLDRRRIEIINEESVGDAADRGDQIILPQLRDEGRRHVREAEREDQRGGDEAVILGGVELYNKCCREEGDDAHDRRAHRHLPDCNTQGVGDGAVELAVAVDDHAGHRAEDHRARKQNLYLLPRVEWSLTLRCIHAASL